MSTDGSEASGVEVVREDLEGRVPVDAVCTGCGQVRVKWVSEDEASSSFRHVCHVCKSVQWMNTIARLSGLARESYPPLEGGDDE